MVEALQCRTSSATRNAMKIAAIPLQQKCAIHYQLAQFSAGFALPEET
jgi:hypothetical protein